MVGSNDHDKACSFLCEKERGEIGFLRYNSVYDCTVKLIRLVNC